MSDSNKSKFPFGLRLTVYVIVIGLMVSITIPVMLPARVTKSRNACLTNLELIDRAMQSWSLSNKKTLTDKADLEAIKLHIKGGILPGCPAGGSYEVHQVKDKPTCSLAATLGHSLP